MPLRLIFMGTPDFAVPTLAAMADAGHDIAAVYTRAPKPAGRGMALQITPVAREAEKRSIPVLTPTTLKTPEAQDVFRAHKADAAVVVAYGLLLPKAILDAVHRGCFNIHASLLPRWRGAAPINRAIMAGDTESGVMVMRMEEGVDTGPVAMTARSVAKTTCPRGLSATTPARVLSSTSRRRAANPSSRVTEGVLRARRVKGRMISRPLQSPPA
jgi:methionyl-tRNA formyltransferase